MRGIGAKRVALLADSEFELRHPMLQRLLRRSGFQLDDFFLGYASEAGSIAELQRTGVKVLATLGETALTRALNVHDIGRWRGRVVPHEHLPGVFVMPLLAPSQLMSRHGDDDAVESMLKRHPPRFHGTFMRDLHHAVAVARDGFSRMPTRYLLDPPPEVFAGFADEYFAALALDPLLGLSWDIETYYKMKTGNEDDFEESEGSFVEPGTILRISFSFIEGYAVSVPWTSSYRPTIARLLASRGWHYGWNGRTFDVPVVTADGMTVGGPFLDGMDAYHMIQSDLPKGLEWVSAEATDVLPWKHLAAAEPAQYSCIDADVGLRNVNYCIRELKKQGQWTLFLNHVVRLMPVLDRAGKHGNKVDRVKRDEIRSKLITMRDELVTEVQQFVPRSLFPRTEFKRQPEELHPEYATALTPDPPAPVALPAWDIIWVREDVKVCTACGLEASNKTEHYKGSKEPHPDKPGKLRQVKNACKLAGGSQTLRPGWVPRFLRLEPFNPNSSDQLKAYMRHFGHPIGRDKRDASKETADATHLKKLHKLHGVKFPLYGKTLVVHKVSKTIGTYTPEPDADDLIHTQYVNSTATWRLGSRKVPHGTQIQNWGKRKDEVPSSNPEEKAALKLAGEARKQIVPRKGHRLVQIDSSAVEAVMQGHYMNDVDYMNLASKSIHAWLSCKALGLEFTPENVDLVKEKHAGLYSKMKVVNYLTNFGGGPKLMTDTYPEDFPTKKDAEDTQEMLYKLLPSLREYHHAVRWEAHTKTFLVTPWGYRHWYYDVFKRKPDGSTAFAKDSKRAVAFKPQNSNAAFQKDNLLLVGYSPIDGDPLLTTAELDARWDEVNAAFRAGRTWGAFMGTNVSIHDSLCLDVPDALVPRAREVLMAIFTRPIPEMHGLRIGAEIEVDNGSWGEMERTDKLIMDNYTIADTEGGGHSALPAVA